MKFRENASLSTEIAVVLKSQDANYIRTVRKQGLKVSTIHHLIEL